MITIIKSNEARRNRGVECGWGNGYVIIKAGHPLFGKNWMEADEVNVHGGVSLGAPLTKELAVSFGLSENDESIGDWVLGFDTMHLNDDLKRWPDAESVQREADKMKEDLIRIDKKWQQEEYLSSLRYDIRLLADKIEAYEEVYNFLREKKHTDANTDLFGKMEAMTERLNAMRTEHNSYK